MFNLNVVLLTGRLGGDAEIKTVPGKVASKVASFNLAVDRSWKDSSGKWHTETDWVRVVTFVPSLIDKVLAKQAVKGRLVHVQGGLRYREWIDGSTGQKRTTLEVEVDNTGGITPVVEAKV